MNWLTGGLLIIPFAVCVLFYGVYYVVLRLAMRRRPTVLSAVPDEALPTVTIIIPTHNEERIIQEMLGNTLKLDYPANKMEIIVVDSASTDGTRDVVRKFLRKSVKLVTQEERQGWNLAVRDAARHARGDVVILGGADVFYDNDAIRRLCARFKDPKVGAATGRQVLLDWNQTLATRMEKDYRRWQEFMTEAESRIDQPFDIKGEIIAVRRNILTAMLDRVRSRGSIDVCAPFETRAQGYTLVFERDATYSERAPLEVRNRFDMQVRRGKNLTESAMHYVWMVGRPRYGIFGMLILPYHLAMLTVMPWVFFAAVACVFVGTFIQPLFLIIVIAIALALLNKRVRTMFESFVLGEAALAAALPFALAHKKLAIKQIGSTRGK